MSLPSVYYLSIKPDKDFVEINQALQKLVGSTLRATAWAQGWNGQAEWAAFQDDLEQLSKQFPETFFTLDVINFLDNSFDVCRYNAKNGYSIEDSPDLAYQNYEAKYLELRRAAQNKE